MFAERTMLSLMNAAQRSGGGKTLSSLATRAATGRGRREDERPLSLGELWFHLFRKTDILAKHSGSGGG